MMSTPQGVSLEEPSADSIKAMPHHVNTNAAASSTGNAGVGLVKIREGKRFLLKEELDEAADCFEQALQQQVEEYGELTDQTGEAYRLYGSALLLIAKRDSSFMGGTDGPSAEEDSKQPSSSGVDDDEAADQSDAEDDDSDPSTFQLAWETLECARIVFRKQDTKDSALRLALVHFDLGEYSLETSGFDQAVAEFEECLKIRQKYFEANDRILAETYYTLALANDHAKRLPQAITNYDSAAAIIQTNIDKLSERNAGQDKSEIETLKEVLQEISQKSKEAKEDIVRQASMPSEDSGSKENARMTEGASVGTTTIGFGTPSSSTTTTSSSPAATATTTTTTTASVLSSSSSGKRRAEPSPFDQPTMTSASSSSSSPFDKPTMGFSQESSGFSKPTGTYTSTPTDLSSRVKKRAKLEPATAL